MTPRQTGQALVIISALLYSTPGLFTRAVDASGWDVTFWRGLFGVAFTSAFLIWRGSLRKDIQSLGGPGWFASAVWATGAIAYIQAYKLTSIANVALIYGSAPILCALVAWLVLKERPRKIVLIASAVAFLGVAIVATGSLGQLNLLGDSLALWMTFSVAIQFAIFRKYPNTSAAGTTVMETLLVLPPSLYFGHPLSVPPHEVALLALFGLVFVIAATVLMEGAKLLPSSETALLSNLEVPVQPVLAYLIFAELPPLATFTGGAIVIAAVLLSQWPQSSTDSSSAPRQ
jgi:drug/metabolite transporter (DMT)-like permease